MNHLSHDVLWSLSREELGASEVRAAQTHLKDCADCRVSLEDVRLAQQVLSVLPSVPPMPEQMARRVGASLAEAADAHAARRFTSWWQSLFTPRFVLAAALGVVLVAVGAWVLASAAPSLSTPVALPTPARPAPLPVPLPSPTRAPTPLAAVKKLSATVASANKSTANRLQVLAEGSTVSTQSGGSVWMKLPDGSRAGLTAASEVKLATLEEKQLILDLTRGSLAMVVPHRLDRVLTVRAGDLEVKDLGTRFLVSRDANRTLVAVEEGKVEVRTPNGIREVHANHAVTWTRGQLTELPWEPSPAVGNPLAPVEAGQPSSIARLAEEDEAEVAVEDDSSPPPEAVMQQPPDRTPIAADEQWEGLPQKNDPPAPPPLKYPDVPLPPPREKVSSLKDIERRLRALGTTITSPTLREAAARNITGTADAGDCQYALRLADRWLSEPTTGAANEPEMRRGVQLQQVRCLNHLGRTQDAETILKMIQIQTAH